MNRKRKNSRKKLSYLHTCEMAKNVVEYLAVYDCIQLFSKKVNTRISHKYSVYTLLHESLSFAVTDSQAERKE